MVADVKRQQPLLKDRRSGGVLTQQLSQWAQMSDKPIVLMLDEADALVGDTLISLLHQIRAGYSQRPEAFPQSIILCGIRDYRIHSSDQEIITGGSLNCSHKNTRQAYYLPCPK